MIAVILRDGGGQSLYRRPACTTGAMKWYEVGTAGLARPGRAWWYAVCARPAGAWSRFPACRIRRYKDGGNHQPILRL